MTTIANELGEEMKVKMDWTWICTYYSNTTPKRYKREKQALKNHFTKITIADFQQKFC
jgi:hypothetical protein